MELRHLRSFVIVAEELHFGRAAARLHIAQPALSRQIRQLEDEIGAALFERTPRGARLTDAGLEFLVGARETLACAERTLRRAQQVHGHAAGRLSVAFVPALLDLPQTVAVLRRFHVTHPEVRVEVRAMPTVEQREALLHGDVQIGFLYYPPADPEIVAEQLLQQEHLLAMPAGHPLAQRDSVPLALAAREPFIWFERAAAPYPYDLVRSQLEKHGLRLRVVDQAASDEARLSMVAAGLGLTLVPATPGTPSRAGIELRPVPEIDDGIGVYVAHARHPSPPAAAFLREVAREIWAMPIRSRTGT